MNPVRHIFSGLLCIIALAGCRHLTSGELHFLKEYYRPEAKRTVNFNLVRLSCFTSRNDLEQRVRAQLTAEMQLLPRDVGMLANERSLQLAVKSLVAPDGITIENQIFIRKQYCGPPVQNSLLLAHEVMHVWQWQNRDTTKYSLVKVALEHLRYKYPYAYQITGKPLLSYRYEQQAAIVADYVYLSKWAPESAETKVYRRLVGEAFGLEGLLRSMGQTKGLVNSN